MWRDHHSVCAYYQWINVIIYSILYIWWLDGQCHNKVFDTVLQSCPLPSPLRPLCPLLPWGSAPYLLDRCSLPTAQVQRRLILTHTTHWTPPLFLHKVIAVRECALQRVAWAPQAQRARLGNKRAKSVLLRHSQIQRLSWLLPWMRVDSDEYWPKVGIPHDDFP